MLQHTYIYTTLYDCVNQDKRHSNGISRRTVLQNGAVLSTFLGMGLMAATGRVAAKGNAELVEAIASQAGLSKADAKKALDGFINATTKALQENDRASWSRFGSFSISKRSARTGRGPQSNGETPTENLVDFKCADELSAQLDLVPGAGDDRRSNRRQRRETARLTDESLIDAERLAREAGLTTRAAQAFLDAFINATTEALKRGDRLSLIGFGSFSISKRSARTGRNPQTGKEIKIAAKNVVKFKAGAELSKAVN